jgi:serine/threonine-protein kinase
MRKADRVVVREAPLASAVLPPPSDCADVEALLGQSPMPANLAFRAEVGQYTAQIAKVNTLRTLGRYPEALALVKSLAERAKHIDYPMLQAALGYGVGMLQSDTSDAGSEATLRAAADWASRARDQKLYAQIWMMLVFEVGFKRARFDDAKPLRRIAWQAVHLAGDDPALVGGLELNEGAVDIVHGDVDAAAKEVEHSLAVMTAKFGPKSYYLVAPLNLLGVIRSTQQHKKEALAIYEHAVAVLSESVSPKHTRVGSILGNMSNIAFDEGRFQDAIDLGHRAMAVLETSLGPDSAEIATELNGLAQPLWAMGKWDEAFDLVERARVIWENKLGHDHPYVAVALVNLAGLRQEQGRCKEALPYLDDARAIEAKVLPANHPGTVLASVFLAGCYNELGRSAEALAISEHALQIAEKVSPLDAAAPRFELARALWLTGKDRARALTLAEDSRKVYAADPGDQAVIRAGKKSASVEIAEWMKGKTAH